MLATKVPSSFEIYNDIDGDVVNFLMVLRQHPVELEEACISIPYSRQLYEEWKWGDKPDNDFERAVRWFYLNRAGVASGNNHKSGWRHSKMSCNPAGTYRSACGLLQQFADRMKYVQIECMDFRKVIQTYDSPDTLFYVDPPYVGREYRYKGGFTEQDHRDLALVLQKIRGHALVSYYEDKLVDELYPGWHREYVDVFKTAQVMPEGEERPKARELLLMNYDAIQQKLIGV